MLRVLVLFFFRIGRPLFLFVAGELTQLVFGRVGITERGQAAQHTVDDGAVVRGGSISQGIFSHPGAGNPSGPWRPQLTRGAILLFQNSKRVSRYQRS